MRDPVVSCSDWFPRWEFPNQWNVGLIYHEFHFEALLGSSSFRPELYNVCERTLSLLGFDRSNLGNVVYDVQLRVRSLSGHVLPRERARAAHG